jgi:outer membrane protein assembly factor BamB
MALEKRTWRTLWKTYLSGSHCEAPLTFADGILVVANRWGFLYGVAPDNGDILWKNRVSDTTDVVLGPDDVLLHTDRTPTWGIVARRLTDGEELWRTELAGGLQCGYRNALTADATSVYAFAYQGQRGRLLALDPVDGVEQWRAPVGGPMSTAVANDGPHLFVEGTREQLIALDPATGKEAWRATIPVGGNRCPPIVVGEHVVGFCGSNLYVVDVDARKTIDVIPMPNPAGIFSYLAYHDGTVYVVNGDDGWIAAVE